MTKSAAKRFAELRALKLEEWTPVFWIVKRKAVQREASYKVLRVVIDNKLKKRLRGYLQKQLQGRKFHLEEYAYHNVDGDDVMFTTDAETDFSKVKAEITEANFDNDLVREYAELMGSWAYVVQFQREGVSLYAWTKINAQTDPKMVSSKGLAHFINHKLIDINEKEIFLIDTHFDFFVYGDITFIANKHEFEKSMNHRSGMIAGASELLAELAALQRFTDIEPIRVFVGDNLHHLRKLAAIRKAGYYKQSDYLQKMIAASKVEKWELKVKDGRIVVEAETIDLLLKLLNNDRLRSPINQELFDSAAKKRVGGQAQSA